MSRPVDDHILHQDQQSSRRSTSQEDDMSKRPPSYKTTASQTNPISNRPVSSKPSFNFLRDFDTHFIIDDSQSMFGNNWINTQKALFAAASYCAESDIKGFSISFFHHEPPESSMGDYIDIRSKPAVHEIFKNVRTCMRTSKPTGKRLQAVADEYNPALRATSHDPVGIRPLKIIVITNGLPTDDIAPVLASIEQSSPFQQNGIGPDQVSIEFWQVGSNGPTSHFFYSTGRLRGIPPTPGKEAQERPRWKYDPEDRKKARPSKNFVKYMATNLLQSTFLRT